MLRIRRIEEAIHLRYKEQRMRCPIHLSIGQEAIAVGVCSHLQTDDVVFSNHRCHAHYLAKGGDLRKMIAELHGKHNGCTKGRGGSMHLIDLDIGFQGSSPLAAGSIPLAAGFAFAHRIKGLSSVCCSFFGEGATEEGVFTETLHFAALHNLALLFICENNSDPVSAPTSSRRIKKRIPFKVAKAHGIFALDSHENRIEEAYEVTKKAIDHIREKKKPAFIEFKTYRLCEHITSRSVDLDHYFDKKGVVWQSHCPIELSRKHLLSLEALSLHELGKMEEKIASEVDESFAFARASRFPIFDLDDEKLYAD